jgi:DNA-binding MarR family transcriptional regulator
METPYSLDEIIAIMTRTFSELEAKALHESDLGDLSMRQIVYLDKIAEMDKPTFSDVAKALNITKPSVTAIVSKLIQKGFLRKEQSSEDKRSYFVLLTEQGKRIIAIHQNLHKQIAHHFASALNESELHQLAKLMFKALKPKIS